MSSQTSKTTRTPTTAPESRRLRKVLVVAYLFPPAGDVGVHRTLRFIKWLPHFGWEPIVLTTRNGKAQSLDESMLERLPDVEVHRTRSFELLNYGAGIDGTPPRRLPKVVSRVFCEIPRDLWRLLAVPDEKRGWVRYAVREGQRLIRSRGIEAVYVTGKPFSSYYIGDILSRRLGVPWIMDLRDLWTLNRRNHPKARWRAVLEKRLERRFVHSASAVIANTPDNRLDFIAAYPECDSEKFVAITNGYDRDDFAGLSAEKYDKFTVAYSGTFYFPQRGKRGLYRRLMGLDKRKVGLLETYSPKCFFQALAQLLGEQPQAHSRIQVLMTGPGCQKVRGLVEEFGLQDTVKPLGWLPYEDSLEMLKRAHAALIVLSRGEESKGWIPSKLFQYLGAGNQVLGMVPEGDVKNIILSTGAGTVVGPDDVDGAKRALERMYQQYRHGATDPPRWSRIENYEARQLTAKLAECLDRACHEVTSER